MVGSVIYFVYELVELSKLDEISSKIRRFCDISKNKMIEIHCSLVSVNWEFQTAFSIQARYALSHVLKFVITFDIIITCF